MRSVDTLEEYLHRYGKQLARNAEESMRPLHLPGRDKLELPTFLRQPFEPQAHVCQAAVKQLKRDRACWINGEMGTGKTLMGECAAHSHAAGQPYRALVFCPGQLVAKWQREIEETLPGAKVFQLRHWSDIVTIDRVNRVSRTDKHGRARRGWRKPQGPEWYIISRDGAKLGSAWQPVFRKNEKEAFLRCPTCHQPLCRPGKEEEQEGPHDGIYLTPADLKRRRHFCKNSIERKQRSRECRAPLWSLARTKQVKNKYDPASYIHKKMHHFFDYLLVDEAHEEKSAQSAQGNAMGALAAASKYVIALTGTLIGGYAEHLRPLLLRTTPTSLVDEGFKWENPMPFNERYGRIETRITEREGGGDSNRQSRGSGRSKTKYVRPGVMPTLFARHLMRTAIFLSLEEVACNLPKLEEFVQEVPMDREQALEYERVEEKLKDEIKRMIVKGDKRLLGAMLATLLGYPDHPYGWEDVGYRDRKDGSFTCVVRPKALDQRIVRPKEQMLLDIVQKEIQERRQVWVYTTMTGERDVAERLYKLMKQKGWRTRVLRSTVELKDREEWIARHGKDCDVVISHPKLVETGLDLFDKRPGGHNFSTLIFYQTGFNLFTLRQASRRSWRIAQRETCRVYYLYYAASMQERAMALMGRKLSAAHAIEGKFSSDGLIALSGDDGAELALAKSLAHKIEEGSPMRMWVRAGSTDLSTGRDMNVGDLVRELDVESDEEVDGWLFRQLAESFPPTTDYRLLTASDGRDGTGHQLTAGHIRRGHLRQQACGKERKDRKLIFLPPTIVRPDLPLRSGHGYRVRVPKGVTL